MQRELEKVKRFEVKDLDRLKDAKKIELDK